MKYEQVTMKDRLIAGTIGLGVLLAGFLVNSVSDVYADEENMGAVEQQRVTIHNVTAPVLEDTISVGHKQVEVGVLASEDVVFVENNIVEVAFAPVENIVAAPVENIVAAPVENIVAAPVENIVAAPVENIVAAPVVKEVYCDTNRVNRSANLTQEEVGYLLESFEGLHGLESVIVELDEQGINAFFTIAVLRLESGNGTLESGRNNLFNVRGLSGEWLDYDTKADSVRGFGKLMLNEYFSHDGLWWESAYADGLSLLEIEEHYCPFVLDELLAMGYSWEEAQEAHWSNRVGGIMRNDYYKIWLQRQ